MSTSTDQLHEPTDLEQKSATKTPRYQVLLNWFGAAFGISVLIGAAFLYLTTRTDPSPEVPTTLAGSPTELTQPSEPEREPPLIEESALADSTARSLLALHVVESLEVHQLEETYAAATQIDESHVSQIVSALAALDAVEWPEQLAEFAADLRTGVAELLEAMQGHDLEETRHALAALHADQHLLASGIYAWLAGVPVSAHEEEEPDSLDAGEARIIEIEMFEFGYEPATIEVQAGVSVILRFTNTGKLPHEAMVGDAHMQEEFAAADDHDDDGDGHHGELMAILVQPGETGDLEVQIEEPGTWYLACHLVGHYEQGQIATINVTA